VGKVFRTTTSPKESGRRFPVAEVLATAGGMAALAGGFLWASTATLYNAFFSFFGERRFVLPLPYEDMIYQGALHQLSALIWVIGGVMIAWMILGELDDSRFPKLVKVRTWIVGVGRGLSILMALAVLWLAVMALLRAEQRGIERARAFASAAESGNGPYIAIRKRLGEKDVAIAGFKIGCSDKLCLLYQSTGQKTATGAPRAQGRTVQVTLDNLFCATTTTLAKGEGAGLLNESAASCVGP
jgi:hypothetical protein